MIDTIFIMPNKETDPDATLMIVVDEKDPSTDPKTYQYVYVGNINDLPSDVLTENSIVNDLSTGGTNRPLSAEQGRTLNSHVNYTTCGSGASDEVKLISDDGFELSTHLRLLVKMTNTNTNSTPKFNINNTGIKDVWYNGSVASDVNTWSAGEVLDVYYDETRYVATPYLNVDEEPTAGSDNLVKSGGIYSQISQLDKELVTNVPFDIVGSVKLNGTFDNTATNARRTDYVRLYIGLELSAYDGASQYTSYRACAFYDKNKTFISCISFDSAGQKTITLDSTNIPSEAYYIVSSTIISNLEQSYVEIQRLDFLEQESEQERDDIDEVTEEFNEMYLSKYIAEKTFTYTINSGSRLLKTYTISDCINMFVEIGISYNGEANTKYSINCGPVGSGNLPTTFTGLPIGKKIKFKIDSNNCHIQIYTTNNEIDSQTYDVSIKPIPYYGFQDLQMVDITEENDCTQNLAANSYYSTQGSTLPSSTTTLSNCKCYKGEIQGGNILHICGKGSSDTVGFFAFYDSTGKKIYGVSASAYRKELFIESPREVSFFVANFYQFDSETDFLKIQTKYSIKTLKDEVGNLQEVRNLMWKEKTVVCFGDSITEFTNSLGKSYTNYIAEITGATVINVGIGGTRIAQRLTPTSNVTNVNQAFAAMDILTLVQSICSGDFSIPRAGALWRYNQVSSDDNRPIIERLAAIDFTKVDIVTILGGVNDWSGGQSIGTSGSSTGTTTLGAINLIVQTLLTTYPNIRLYWFTPVVHWAPTDTQTSSNWGDNEVVNGITLKQFVETVKAEIFLQKIPICDLYNTLGWNQYNFDNYFVSTDGTHPYKGFDAIGRKIVSFINSNRTF